MSYIPQSKTQNVSASVLWAKMKKKMGKKTTAFLNEKTKEAEKAIGKAKDAIEKGTKVQSEQSLKEHGKQFTPVNQMNK
jgi:hypothetical protein